MTANINLKQLREYTEYAIAEGRTGTWLDAYEYEEILALIDTAEAAIGAAKYARPVDLQAAVVQGGYTDLRETLNRYTNQ